MGIRDWWNKLSGAVSGAQSPYRVAETPGEATSRAVHRGRQTLGNGLVVDEYHHAYTTNAGRLVVRSFQTDGLLAHGAHEVRVTLPADADAATLGAALDLLAMQGKFAIEGRPAVLGGFTGLRTKGAADGKILGVTYARGVAIDGIDGSEAALVAVRLHEDELAMVQKGLATRVLGALASRARFFPYPPWWELRTTPVLGLHDQEQSTLEKIRPWVSAGDTHVTRIDETRLRVSLPRSAARMVAEVWRQLPDAEAVTLLAALAPDADGQMIWEPGATEPIATAAGDVVPKRMGHAFVSLLRVDANAVHLVEDGVALMLAAVTFDQVREALTAGRDLTLPVTPDTTLAIEFRTELPDTN